MCEVNRMTFSICDYDYGVTKDKALLDMYRDVAYFLQIIIKNGYIATIRDEDSHVVIIDYNHDENKDYWGCKNPYWITEDEYLSIVDNDDNEELNEDLPEGNKIIKELGIQTASDIYKNMPSLVGKEIDLSKLDD